MVVWSKFMTSGNAFKACFIDGHSTIVNIEGFGEIDVGHMSDYPSVRDEANCLLEHHSEKDGRLFCSSIASGFNEVG